MKYSNNFVINVDNDKIGEGGEGGVFNLNQDKVVKIYNWNKKNSDDRESKLKKITYMIENPPKDLTDLAWPESLVFTDNSANIVNFAGFTMKAFRSYHTIGNVYDSEDRENNFKSSKWRFLFIIARNFTYVVEQLHANNYILGDINEGNILVDAHAKVALIDCDSYKVIGKDFGERTVGRDEYTPKERLDQKMFGVVDIVGERFSLAILLFKILMLGAHPFNVVYLGNDNVPLRSQNIMACKSIFSGGIRPLSTPPLDVLPLNLKNLFERAIGTGCNSPYERPSSKDWFDAFELVRKNEMKQCKVNKNHIYYGDTNMCPWCRYWEDIGTDPFPLNLIDVTFILEGLNQVTKWFIYVDEKVYTCEGKSITVSLENGEHVYSAKSEDGDLVAGKSRVNVKGKQISKKITLKPKKYRVSFQIIGVVPPKKFKFTITRLNSDGSKGDSKVQSIQNTSGFKMHFIPGKYVIEGVVDEITSEYEMIGESIEFEVKKSSNASQKTLKIYFKKVIDNNTLIERNRGVLRYLAFPMFSALLSAISLISGEGKVPSVFLTIISAISVFDFTKTRRKKTRGFLIFLLVLFFAYLLIYLTVMFKNYGMSALNNSTFIIYLLLFIYSISLIITTLMSHRIGLSRAKAFIPAAIMPVAWIVLFELGIL